ncbi:MULTISPECIES: hypothetical protein [unclassified Nostoc]|uniref:hypothetical protein n=1 Tax=unclassified Nostoc TaxID=2593658 RepID=UPI0018EFA256|nr:MULTISPECIES: hypothetical protein [unclassified Nostoc]
MKLNQLVVGISSFIVLAPSSVVTLHITPVLAQSSSICACITSEAQPQLGQINRSSGNFSTQGCATSLRWSGPDGVNFNVMRDVSGGTDPVELTNVTNGSLLQNPNQRSLYIANPTGAQTAFQVCANNPSTPAPSTVAP